MAPSYRTGYEGMAPAIQGAFDTYYRRKEGQRERKFQGEQAGLDREAAMARIMADIQGQKDVKGIPTTHITKVTGASSVESALYGDIATTIDAKVEELLPLIQSAENYDDFIAKSEISAMFPDKLDKDEFTWLQQNRAAAAQYLKRNIAEYSIPRSNLVEAQEMELKKYLGELKYLDRVDWTPYYEWYDEQEGIKTKKKEIKEKRAEPLLKSEFGDTSIYPEARVPKKSSQQDYDQLLESLTERQRGGH